MISSTRSAMLSRHLAKIFASFFTIIHKLIVIISSLAFPVFHHPPSCRFRCLKFTSTSVRLKFKCFISVMALLSYNTQTDAYIRLYASYISRRRRRGLNSRTGSCGQILSTGISDTTWYTTGPPSVPRYAHDSRHFSGTALRVPNSSISYRSSYKCALYDSGYHSIPPSAVSPEESGLPLQISEPNSHRQFLSNKFLSDTPNTIFTSFLFVFPAVII